jgi:hypothetical protein
MSPAVYDEVQDAYVPVIIHAKPVQRKPESLVQKPMGPDGELPSAPGANIVDETPEPEKKAPSEELKEDGADEDNSDVAEDVLQQLTKREIVKSAAELLNVELDGMMKKDDLIRAFRKVEKEHFDSLKGE